MAKLLLYCCKQPHKLFNTDKGFVLTDFELGDFYKDKTLLNGKIVAECDFEVEEIVNVGDEYDGYQLYTSSMNEEEILEKSCLGEGELFNYIKVNDNFYAIHIKNLHIFDKPRKLSDYNIVVFDNTFVGWHLRKIKKAPQNMMKIITHQEEDASAKWITGPSIEVDYGFREYCLISIRPEWLCKILNGEKTIEIRKKVLKEMLK